MVERKSYLKTEHTRLLKKPIHCIGVRGATPSIGTNSICINGIKTILFKTVGLNLCVYEIYSRRTIHAEKPTVKAFFDALELLNFYTSVFIYFDGNRFSSFGIWEFLF